VHNHPSGSPEPSSQDIAITNQLKEAGLILGIAVLDHVNWMDPFQFFIMAEDVPEDHAIDIQDMINCAENIGAIPVGVI